MLEIGEKRKSRLRAAFIHLAAQVLARKEQHALCVLDPPPRVETRVTLTVVARTLVADVAKGCVTCPARFSGRVVRSAGDLSPRVRPSGCCGLRDPRSFASISGLFGQTGQAVRPRLAHVKTP